MASPEDYKKAKQAGPEGRQAQARINADHRVASQAGSNGRAAQERIKKNEKK